MVNLALLKLLKESYQVNHTLDVLDIHKHLFSDVYEWAGKIRTINIEKAEVVLQGISVLYDEASNIRKEVERIHTIYFDKPWDNYSASSLIYELTRYMSSLWKVHPFREGNTRTLSTYMFFFLKQHGYSLDEKLLKTHAAYFRNALVMASLGEYSEYHYLEDILADAVIYKSNKRQKNQLQSSKYEKIKGVKMKNYTYNYHQQKKD